MQLHQRLEEFRDKNIEIIVITFENEEKALNYQKDIELGMTMAIDQKREMYSYYGMEKAGFLDLWGFKSLKAYFIELLKGNFPKAAHGDIHQRGGNVLIDPNGMVRMHHIGKGPADRPKADDVLNIVKEIEAEIAVNSKDFVN